MLVLSRKQNQEIIIGDDIKITLLKIKGNTIRLGIEAPRSVKVLRGELPTERRTPSLHDDPANSPSHRQSTDSGTVANMTVVFSNEDEANVDVIPFCSDESIGSDETFGSDDSAGSDDSVDESAPGPIQNAAKFVGETPASISFRRQLPKTLEHNRLKELVKQLTRSK